MVRRGCRVSGNGCCSLEIVKRNFQNEVDTYMFANLRLLVCVTTFLLLLDILTLGVLPPPPLLVVTSDGVKLSGDHQRSRSSSFVFSYGHH
jgi:hypothetical protein